MSLFLIFLKEIIFNMERLAYLKAY